MSQMPSILNRIAVSQKMAEQRAKTRKLIIDGRTNLKSDDGDHGFGSKGYVKRKDLSNKLLHVFLDSPRKRNIRRDMIKSLNEAGLQQLIDLKDDDEPFVVEKPSILQSMKVNTLQPDFSGYEKVAKVNGH